MFEPKVIIFRLFLAATLGAIIGTEREYNNRPAGVRTHALVCLGSALLMLVSIDGFSNLNLGDSYRQADAARIAAQVISGIGFLGAGTIIHNEKSIYGLTTAACLWVSAGIGLAIGCGYYVGGILTCFLSLVILVLLRQMEIKAGPGIYRVLEVVAYDRPGIDNQIVEMITNRRGQISDVKEKRIYQDGENYLYLEISFYLRKTDGINSLNSLNKALERNKDISEIRYITKTKDFPGFKDYSDYTDHSDYIDY